MKKLPFLLLLLPILTSCPEKASRGDALWAAMNPSVPRAEFLGDLAQLGSIRHKLYYDAAAVSIAHYCPLTKEEREILRAFNTKYLPLFRDYSAKTFMENSGWAEELGKRLEKSAGIRNGRPSDEHLSALEKLESYTERNLNEAFRSGRIVWNAGEKKLEYSGADDAEKTTLNELNEKCLRDFIDSYSGDAKLAKDKATDIVHHYLISLCVAKSAIGEPKPRQAQIGWDDRNALFMVLRNVTPKHSGGNTSGKQLKAFSLYYASKDDSKANAFIKNPRLDVDIALYDDPECSNENLVGSVSSSALLHRSHNQLLRMVPNSERGYSRVLFFKNKDACRDYLVQETNDQNPPPVTLEEKQEVQKAVLGGPLENRGKKNRKDKNFDDYGIVATEPATGQAISFDRDILFPIVFSTDDNLQENADEDNNAGGVASLRDAAGNAYGDRLYGVLSVTNQDTIPRSDVQDSLLKSSEENSEEEVNVLQIYFVMDLTGSMTPYKDDILASLEANFIEPLKHKSNDSLLSSVEVGFIGYKDFPDLVCNGNEQTQPRGYRIKSFEFPGRGDGATGCIYNYTHQGMVPLEEFADILRQVRTAGELAAGDTAEQRRVSQDPVPEAMRGGLAEMTHSGAWQPARPDKRRRNVTRYAIVIGDAPDHLNVDKFVNEYANPLTQWANDNNCVILPIYIRDLRKQSNRRWTATAEAQFRAILPNNQEASDPIILDAKNGDFAAQFSTIFHGFSNLLISRMMVPANRTAEDRQKIMDSLSDEQMREEYGDDEQTLEQMLQAAALARYAFGSTMSVWVSKEKKEEFQVFSALNQALWVATKDPLSFAGGVTDGDRKQVYSVMKPAVMLSMADAEVYLRKCEEALTIYNESSSGNKAEQRDLRLIARLAANFLASSVDPTSLLEADPEELSRIFERGSKDFTPNTDLPVQSRFALELLNLIKNKDANVQPIIEGFADRVARFKKRLDSARRMPLEQRVFYTQEAYHEVQAIYQDNVDKGAEAANEIINKNERINGRSAIVVPYDELP